MTRVLWSSNGPHVPTGYGQQTKHVLRAIRDLGYPVACHAWWGVQGGTLDWERIPLYPSHFDGYGNDAAAYYCRLFKADVLITLIDLWVLPPELGQMGNVRFCPWFPLDHADPLPAAIAERFPYAHKLLVYSRYAERTIREYEGGKYADKVVYIPHGMAVDVYRPASDDERRAFRRKMFPDWPEDAYIAGMVAANKGYPCRKSFPEAIEAFARFASRHPEARLYLHSYPGPEFKGIDLQALLRQFGVADRTRIANPKLLLGGDYTDEQMREVYCALDVLLSPSQGEGFGLPILEAQSCGTPVIVTDHSAMSELVAWGCKVTPLRLVPSLLGGRFAEADVAGVDNALEACREMGRSAEGIELARRFALTYSWERVIRDYWAPFLASLDAGRRELSLQIERERQAESRVAA